MDNLRKLEIALICYAEKFAETSDFRIIFRRKYSKTYYGYYNMLKKEIVIFLLDKYGKPYKFNHLLRTLFHEIAHHEECSAEGYKRLRGVQHSKKWVDTFAKYLNKLWYRSDIYEVDEYLGIKGQRSRDDIS